LSVLKASCPSCAAPIEFQKGSTIVLVCPFCRSAVARTDRGLDDLGKVAEIMDSESPLKLGLSGEYKGHKFQLTGRAQLRHELGGVWDEWYATFSNGWVGWLAEAQGRFYLTFYQPLPQGTQLPGFDQLAVGQPINAGANQFVVAEKGVATSVAADGEIPYKLEPNEESHFADLSGAGNAFATIDYSVSPAWLFVGNQVTLEEIGLGSAKSVKREAQRVAASGMGCPNCAGPLTLTAPDKAERVTCPYCNSLLDVNQGNLTWLKSLEPPASPPDFLLKIGAEGTFMDNVRFKVIGAVVRSVTMDGITYYWHEYLLYNPLVGFRWLTHSDNHWSFVEPVNPGDVEFLGAFGPGSTAKYNGKKFKIFQNATAVVRFVQGEFYGRVEQGESVHAVDFVAPPLTLSMERSENEINWSVGVYQTNEDIEKAFGIEGLPKPWNVAPNQPFSGGFYIKWGFGLLGLLLFVAIAMLPFSLQKTELIETITLQPTASATTPQTAFSRQFEIKGRRNVRITAGAQVNNSWADLDIDIVNEQNQEIESVNIPIEYYSGSDSDGSWSEGSRTKDATMSSLPGGKYTIRVEGTWQNFQQPMPVEIKVEQNVSRGVNFCCAFVVLALLPVFGLIRKLLFESRRWRESEFGSTSSDSE
jgi:Zn finger protein HypA/HybF involved in hydrogenase expression